LRLIEGVEFLPLSIDSTRIPAAPFVHKEEIFMLTPGELAPDFQILDDEGKLVKLSDFRGKKVVLYFYPEDFTSGCELQACAFRDAYPQIAAKNAIVLGVSKDSVERHKEFREALNLPFHLLADADLKLTKSWNCYGPRTRPDGTTYEGVIRGHYVIGEDGRVLDVQVPVKPVDSTPLALGKL
jgi:peroxiredoxin Q/BCP